MRSYHKSWQNRRPGWTKRVRWFKPGTPGERIRLEFTDRETGIYDKPSVTNEFFDNADDAQSAFDEFIAAHSEPEAYGLAFDAATHPDNLYDEHGRLRSNDDD